MIIDAFVSLFTSLMSSLPIIELTADYTAALDFVTNIVGFVNVFLPLVSLVPIILLIVAVRNFNIIMSVVNWVLRLIPFIG